MIRPAPGIPIEQQNEAIVVRLLLWGEARGESVIGKLAVLWVLHNRAMKRDSTLKAEALRPFQFSCFNPDDPNRNKLLMAWKDDPVGWAICDAVVSAYESGNVTDPTGGALNYYVEKMPKPPEWGRGHAGWKETGVIGRHVFGIAEA